MKLPFQYRAIGSQVNYGLRALCRLPLFTSIALLLFFSSDAAARLSGDASLDYSAYEGSAGDPDSPGQRNSMSSSSLVQKYSLLYSSNGLIYNSRVGSYNIALGYDFASLDSTFKSSAESTKEFNVSRGHLLYLGEVKINPKEVPFKLVAYSRDMNRITATTSNGGSIDPFSSLIGGRIQPTVITDGLKIENGATLIAGVKNGMTNGYNEVLRHFPMLLVDFKDSIHRDYRSLRPTDDRLTRLAFVSLNKKDNWFHYRHLRYKDYIDPANNYDENQIQLGTVDQNLDRRWIDFSNWIRVSTDVQLSKRKTVDKANPTEEINFNMFVTAERTKWSAYTFSSFNRFVAEDRTLSYQTSLPLYVSGLVSQDLSWNTRLSFRDNQDVDISGISSNFTNILAGYSLNAFKRASFVLNQGIDVESSAVNSSDILTLSGNIGTSSTPLFSRTVTLGASYRVRNSTNSSSGGASSDILLQNIDLRGGYAPAKTLRFEMRQSNLFTHGKISNVGNTPRNSQSQLSQYGQQGLDSSEIGSESYQSTSAFSATWNPKPRLNIKFAIKEEISKSDLLPVTNVTGLSSEITFSNSSLNLKNSLGYSRDNHNNSSISDGASLGYVYSRGLKANVSASYAVSDSNGDHAESASFSQGLNYSYFTTNGTSRTLFEINESMTRTVGSPKSLYPTSNAFTLGLRYYPISRLTLSSGLRYSSAASMSDYSLAWHASASANFRLLQASVDYTSGLRTSDKLRENKLTGNIRKSF